jgi:hypothetical protein
VTLDLLSERDPFRDRFVRFVAMFGSTVAAAAILIVAMYVAEQASFEPEAGLVVVGFLAIDLLVFGWVVRRFEITPPRAFREVEDG